MSSTEVLFFILLYTPVWKRKQEKQNKKQQQIRFFEPFPGVIFVDLHLRKIGQYIVYFVHIEIILDFPAMVGIGIAAFVPTNIDDLFILMIFFATPDSPLIKSFLDSI